MRAPSNAPNFGGTVARTGKGSGGGAAASSAAAAPAKPPKPDAPWTTQERLTAFYEKYVPEKVESVPTLLEKYAGKEENLFNALIKKYGPEPHDPYYTESDEDGDDDEEEDADEDEQAEADNIPGASKKNRRGASAKLVVAEHDYYSV